MNKFYQEYLFNKHILIGSESSDAVINVIYLAKVFNIKVLSGKNLASTNVVTFAAKQLGMNIPAPFYKGFPDSVRLLSPLELLADQIFHYINTYGMNNFSGSASHSIFEQEIERKLFNEKTPAKEFIIIDEASAKNKIIELANALLESSRPLNDSDYHLVQLAITDGYISNIKNCNSKFNAIKLAYDFYHNNPYWSNIFIKFLKLHDVLKVLDYLKQTPNKLKLKNQDRKFLTHLINVLSENISDNELSICFEKRQIWKGLLHHIHYHGNKALNLLFTSKKNISAYSAFENKINSNPTLAASKLKTAKGNGALLRKLNYLISRCKTKEQVKKILTLIDNKNVIILIQLILQYQRYSASNPRTFKFVKNNLTKVHQETKKEFSNRKSIIKSSWLPFIIEQLQCLLKKTLKHKITGSVYIDPNMDQIAIPLQQANSSSGFGCLPSGSIINLPKAKVFRLFTYWEKVNDIDLSSIGLTQDGKIKEFSWRTFYQNQNKAITFSGDITNGYNGGSEYIDINVDEFRKKYPDLKYLIMCDNVFSGTGFNNCICKAGYMIRNKVSSGEIFEPKTVQTSFTINANSNFAAMFALDLVNNQLIWLNINIDTSMLYGYGAVAATSNLNFLTQYFDITKLFSVKKLFTLAATKIVSNPTQADLIVSDQTFKLKKDQTQIHSYDFEKIFKILN